MGMGCEWPVAHLLYLLVIITDYVGTDCFHPMRTGVLNKPLHS